MKRNGLFALIALALGGMTATAAQAEDYSNWYIAPRVGAVIPDSDRETDSSLFTGLGLGWWSTPNLAVDFEWSLNDADFENDSARNGHEWESVGLGVSARYFFGEAGTAWRPYVMGGIGALRHANISQSQLPEGRTHGWDPMVTAGGGIQYNFGERVAFRGEIAARYDRDNNSRQYYTPEHRMGFTDVLVTGGLVINFGGGETAPPDKPIKQDEPGKPPTSCRDLDDDKDGVNNCDDRCPGTSAGTNVGPDGCPLKVVIDLRGVNFKFDRPKKGEKNIAPTLQEPTAESIAILDQAVDALQRNPDVRVEVAGHTDAVGTDEYNQGLSERRARIVYDYLTSHGIDASRLSGPVGFGESKPIDTNDTKEGRARNRRTELDVQ
ncbi:OmpA family protein [Tahibacter amnicola]|uniref:OmpA family protein n=1 Tax=Tahibacter amnicola TaxID=2976241 RepID=A0ABY6BBU2_9GAMM|nr:OmpA family protein [Tahibacter amnicola]UXI67334.1 OmpA family protein [Tahibacter amnicola]